MLRRVSCQLSFSLLICHFFIVYSSVRVRLLYPLTPNISSVSLASLQLVISIRSFVVRLTFSVITNVVLVNHM